MDGRLSIETTGVPTLLANEAGGGGGSPSSTLNLLEELFSVCCAGLLGNPVL